MDRYAVIGNPVAHSKSPLIHAAFAAQTGQAMQYETVLAPLDGFVAAVEAFRSTGGRGLNVTVPFKLEAHALATRRSPRAEAAGAVNTLAFDGDTLFGDNTDGAGLVRDLEHNLDCPLAGRRVLLLGAGGASRGAVVPLLGAGPRSLFIANRSADKADALVEHFRACAGACLLEGGGFPALAGRAFDVIINATSASLSNAVPDLPAGLYADGALAYDMMYGQGDTPFMRVARERGASRLADGLGMLVEQAAESFFVWRGIRPDTGPVLQSLRQRS